MRLVALLHSLALLECRGPVVAEGFVLNPKQNHEPEVLDGWRRIHRCVTCHELYSYDREDLVDPKAKFVGQLQDSIKRVA